MIGTVDFEAGGQAYSMRVSTNAQVRYQRAAGETFLNALDAIQKDPSDTERLRRLIWASMSHIEGLTEEAAGDVMDDLGVEDAIMKLSDAVSAAYPSAADASGNGPRANKARPKKK